MAGKREEKKRILKKKILEAAKKVFIENGFNNTTIEQIAKEAGVGLGTAYNYFGSKSELFTATMGDLLKVDEYENLIPKYSLDASVYEIISSIMTGFIETLVSIDKNLLKELFTVIMGSMSTDNKILTKNLMEIDYKLIDELTTLLLEFKKSGKLKDEFDVQSGVYVMYSIVMQIFILILFSDDIPYDSHIENMKNQLKLVISPYEL